jgi:hypothetical protein
MTEPWTPGPWTVEGIWEDGYGSRDREREPADLWTVDPVMTTGGYDGLWHGGIEREADARLIAAAPEIVEDVLIPLVEDEDIPFSVLRDRAIALLARIRGA